MKATTKQKIRDELLRCRPNGLTSNELSDRLSINPNLVRVTLTNMDDVYIYKWMVTKAGHGFIAVWKCVPVPENAARPETPPPKPRRIYDEKYKARKRAMYAAKCGKVIQDAGSGIRTQIRGPWPTQVQL
jgi:hypothetical protein